MQERLYFFAIVPPEPLYSQVRLMKEEIRDVFGCSWALRSPAHITLYMPFRWQLDTEGLLVRSLHAFARMFTPFTLQVNGFASFAPRVLYLNIEPSLALLRLHTDLQAYLCEQHGLCGGRHRPFHPHMTLAHRDVLPEQFDRMWTYYKNRHFIASFEAKGFYLLRHEQKRWHEKFFFPFQN